jgi:hypothetical protein
MTNVLPDNKNQETKSLNVLEKRLLCRCTFRVVVIECNSATELKDIITFENEWNFF